MREGPAAVLVDARAMGHPTARERGIGRYVTGLLNGMAAIDAPVVAMVGSAAESASVAEAVPGVPIEILDRATVRRYASRAGHADGSLAGDVWYLATQLLLHPLALDPVPSCVTEAGLPVAAVMYDVIPYRYPETYLDRLAPRRQAPLRAALARTLDAVLAISRFAGDTAIEELHLDPRRVAVVGAGVDGRFRPAQGDPWDALGRVLPDRLPFVVAVTGGDERKNTHGLLQAWGRLPHGVRSGRHLVVVAAAAPAVLARWQGWAADAACIDDVVFTGAVTDEEMVALLQAAELAVVPSLEEGFGLPVLEAAACGTPVICSGVSSMPEILEEEEACFDPKDPDAIAAAIVHALTEPDRRELLRAAGRRAVRRWGWEATATATISALGAARPLSRARRTVREQIALVGPFEGSPSGIGAYDVRVAAAIEARTPARLVRLADLSCSAATSRPGPDRFPAGAAGSLVKLREFDHVVVALGSSPHHLAGERIARDHPCHVWLHDGTLAGLHVGLAHLSGSERWAQEYLRERLVANHPARVVECVEAGDPARLLDVARYGPCGATLLREVLREARSIVVPSDEVLDRVRGALDVLPPVLVAPLAFPTVSLPAPVERRAEIVAAGWLAPNKAPDLALHVLAELSDVACVRLVFLGAAQGGTGVDVEVLARRLGLSERVEITGWVDEATYGRRIGAARVGLQLRRGSTGEMSAAVADLMAHGTPVVTNVSGAGAGSTGVRVVGPEATAEEVADVIRPLLVAGSAWDAASTDVAARAAAWTFDDLADELLRWLAEAGGLAPGSIRRVPASTSRTA